MVYSHLKKAKVKKKVTGTPVSRQWNERVKKNTKSKVRSIKKFFGLPVQKYLHGCKFIGSYQLL